MATKTITYRDNKFSEDVKKLNIGTSSNTKSRYTNKLVLTTDNGSYTRSMQIEDLVCAISPGDTYILIPIRYQYNPYAIAYEYYGNKDLYWIILSANRLVSSYDLLEGMTIRIPDISSIYGIHGLMERNDA